jgi:hypothetical protein
MKVAIGFWGFESDVGFFGARSAGSEGNDTSGAQRPECPYHSRDPSSLPGSGGAVSHRTPAQIPS